MRRSLILAALLASFSRAGWAQTATDFEKVLLPVTATDVHGAFGSLWTTGAWILPNTDRPLVLRDDCIAGNGDLPPVLIPRVVNALTLCGAADTPASLMYVPRDQIADTHIALRVMEVGVNPKNAGIDIPVVRERDFLSDEAVFIAVPNSARTRGTLRIYNVNPERHASMRVRILDSHQESVGETTVQLSVTPKTILFNGANLQLRPESAEIPFVGLFPQGATQDELTIVVQPLTSGTSFWAFVTITDNVTQQVTLIRPN